MKWEKKAITVKKDWKTDYGQVDAIVLMPEGLFAVHKIVLVNGMLDKSRLYTLTHVPTGGAIRKEMSYADAKALAVKLASPLDERWGFRTQKEYRAVAAELWKIVSASVMEIKGKG